MPTHGASKLIFPRYQAMTNRGNNNQSNKHVSLYQIFEELYSLNPNHVQSTHSFDIWSCS